MVMDGLWILRDGKESTVKEKNFLIRRRSEARSALANHIVHDKICV